MYIKEYGLHQIKRKYTHMWLGTRKVKKFLSELEMNLKTLLKKLCESLFDMKGGDLNGVDKGRRCHGILDWRAVCLS